MIEMMIFSVPAVTLLAFVVVLADLARVSTYVSRHKHVEVKDHAR